MFKGRPALLAQVGLFFFNKIESISGSYYTKIS